MIGQTVRLCVRRSNLGAKRRPEPGLSFQIDRKNARIGTHCMRNQNLLDGSLLSKISFAASLLGLTVRPFVPLLRLRSKPTSLNS
jgi:hypothetical protein